MHRFWRVSLLVCALLTAAPLFLSRHLPFSDLPEHVAVIATLRHWWDPAWRSQELYTLSGPATTPSLLYYVVGALLAVPFANAETANLAMLCAVAVGIPYALRALLRSLHPDERLAVFACPLFWNRALAEGLLSYVASIPLVLWGIALAVRQARSPTRRRGVGLATLALVLFYLHVSGFVVFLGGACLVTVLVPLLRHPSSEDRLRPDLVGLARRLVWLGPVTVPAVALALGGNGVRTDVIRFSPQIYLLRQLPGWLHDFWRSPGDDAAAALLWLAFLALLLRRRRPADRRMDKARIAGASLVALALALYFLLPSQVGFAFLLDVRNAPFIALFAPLVLPARNDLRARVGLVAMTVASAALSVHAAWQMHAYERDEASDFDEILRNLPRGRKLLTLVFERRSRYVHVTPFVHFGGYYRIRYGGVASFSFAELSHWPVRYRPEEAPPKKRVVFWDWNPCLYRNSHDGPYYDFVMARGAVDPFGGEPPGPKWRIIGGAGEWRLWQRVPGTWEPAVEAVDVGPCPAGG